MKLDAKTIYAQSSDIKARTYLQYRKDMKKKAIAELEILPWLENKIKNLYPEKKVKVYKSGGDKFLWFLRKGNVSHAADFTAQINEDKLELEFQYAEKTGLDFYDFKISKVVKKQKGKRLAIKNKLFIYIHKPLLKYGFFKPEWISKNGQCAMVPAWRTPAFRVPKNKFEKVLLSDNALKELCVIIDKKNFILNFQHEFTEIKKDKFSSLLQGVIDENKIVKIIPKDLDSFFKVCLILDHLNKVPQNANLWLVYLLSYLNQKIILEDIAKVIYCLDFLYAKIILKQNERQLLENKIKELLEKIKKYGQKDGSYKSSISVSPLEETRVALFTINLLEDLTQDMLFYYNDVKLNPIKKIYENVTNLNKTFYLIKKAISR